jgi:hypothetical protein
MSLRRGEVYAYTPVLPRPGQSLLRLIVSADALNNSPVPLGLGLQVVANDPGSLRASRATAGPW